MIRIFAGVHDVPAVLSPNGSFVVLRTNKEIPENIPMAPDEQAPTCRGLDCMSTHLIDAHIIPEGFARFVRRDEHNVILTKQKTKTTPQLGDTDRSILCAECDRKLGVYDDALLRAAKNFKRMHKNTGTVWALPKANADQFSKGVFAILWRASLSQRPGFTQFSLGEYEDVIRDILFGRTTFAHRPDISLLAQRHTSKYFDISRFYTNPSLAPFMGLSAGGLSLAGFRFLAKFDPNPLAVGFRYFDIPQIGQVRGFYVETEKTPEFQGIAEMVIGDIKRSTKKTR
jgi:hypothetical protein